MKILMVCEFFPSGGDLKFSGGVEARTFYVAKYLAKKHEVFIIASNNSKNLKIEKMFNFTIYRVGSKQQYTATVGNIFDRIKFIIKAVKFAKNIDVDIVDGGNFVCHFIAKIIAINKKIPVVAWYPDVWVGTWLKNSGPLGIFGEILERVNLLLGFDGYIAISASTAKKLKKFTKKDIRVIPCGIDKSEFKSRLKKTDNPTIISISRLAKYKNLGTLIKAFSDVVCDTKTARLIIVGRGPEYERLLNLIKILKLEKKVRLLANLTRKHLIELLESSHIFSLPSTVEGFGISIIEAAAAGTPYVVSDIDVFREITKNGFGGLLFSQNNPYDLSQKIKILLTDKNLYDQKVKECQSLSENYQWLQIAVQTEAVYESILPKIFKVKI